MSILVTGASSGFGAAICETLVNAGYRVIGAARRLEKLQALQNELGGNFLPLQMDVGDTASVDQALAALPAAQRDVFEKTELQGLSFKQLAEESGLPVQTLLSRKHKAVRYLRSRLAALYHDIMLP